MCALLAALLLPPLCLRAQTAQPEERSHASQVMGDMRTYRLYLPPAYATSQKRYPVVYWLHGYERSTEQADYGRSIAAYVGTHDVIVADAGPIETTGEFPLYLPELVDHLDHTLRTIADRDHRGVTGYSAGGFMAFWIAGKYPDLFGSASSFMGPTEYTIGPKGFDAEWNFDEFRDNYSGVRTRLVTGKRDFIRFYHRRLNAIWSLGGGWHETEEFDSEHGFPEVAKTLDFHLHAFAKPLPKPELFSHADVYPNFAVWGWEVTSNRRQPGFTVLENVSAAGFRCAVREWVPGGSTLPEVKLSVTTPPGSFAPASSHPVAYLRLRDGYLRRATLKADGQGRVSFDLDGDAWQVAIGEPAVPLVTGYEIEGASWATASQPVHLKVKFWNPGTLRSAASAISWASPDSGVTFDPPTSRLFALGPGESASVSVTVTVTDPARPLVDIEAVCGKEHRALEVPLFPPTEPFKNFLIADGRAMDIFHQATKDSDLTLGEGNGDGYAAPGESFAVLIPDGAAFRAAELFTSDACVDLGVRVSDPWSDYDHTGASAKYTVARIRPECQPGHPLHLLARVVFPNAPEHQVRYYAIEFPVWYRRGEEPK
jgi:hypothetical protein